MRQFVTAKDFRRMSLRGNPRLLWAAAVAEHGSIA